VEPAPQGPDAQLSRRVRRLVVPVALLAVVLTLLVVGLAGVAMLGMKADLERGQARVREARRALVNGELGTATDRFEEASGSFAAAERRAGGLPARAGSWLPLVGNNVDVAAAMAAAGVDVAAAGQQLAGTLAELPDGLGSLAPSDGRLPLETIGVLASPVAEAAALTNSAVATIDAAPDAFLFGVVAEARWEARSQVAEAARAFDAASALLRGLPAFGGVDGDRHYLVASENPAELRGTGGIWGAYAILTMRDGVPAFSRVRSIQELPDVETDDVSGLGADYERNYRQFGGAGSWQNLNMTPDLPSAAQAALGAFEAATGRALDGLIVADPFALEAMLRVTGPAKVPGVADPLTADNVVAFTTNEAYERFELAVVRKEVLGDVAINVLERFLDLEGKGIARIRALATSAAAGHLKVYTGDGEFQQGLELAGTAAGRFVPPAEGDLLGVHVNNASGSKIDYFATHRITHEIRLGGDGEAVTTTTVSLGNDVPTSGQPRYVVGPFSEELSRGDQRSLTTVSCHDPCTFVDAAGDGGPVELDVGSELGVAWYRDLATIPPGGSHELVLSTRTSGVWQGNGSGGVYRLTVLGRPTIEPAPMTLRIHPPAGTRIVWTDEPTRIEGDVAVWEGTVQPRLELEVRFSAPLPLRWWRNITRPFGGP